MNNETIIYIIKREYYFKILRVEFHCNKIERRTEILELFVLYTFLGLYLSTYLFI